MKKRLIIVICFCLLASRAVGFFSRDRAAQYAQRGQWDKVGNLLTNLVVENPTNSDLLYDAGVASFNQKQFEKSHAYFCNAASCDGAPDLVKEKAHFNAGNSCVELKKLEEAIEQYETVLAMNPENQEAQHNLEVVKKMLEQKQQQQQNQDQKNQDQNNDQQNQDKNKDQNKNDQQQQDQQQNQNQSNDSGQQQQSDKDKNDQSQGERGSDHQKQQEERQDNRSDESSEQSNSDDQRDHEDGIPDKSEDQQNKNESECQEGHDESPEQEEQQSGTQDKQQEAKAQENKAGSSTPAGAQRYDKEVQRILAAVGERDAQANKQMMAVRVQKAAGKHDENQKNY